MCDGRLETSSGVGEPVRHLCDRHTGVDGQSGFLVLRRVRVVAVPAQPSFERPRHVLQGLSLLVHLAGDRSSVRDGDTVVLGRHCMVISDCIICNWAIQVLCYTMVVGYRSTDMTTISPRHYNINTNILYIKTASRCSSRVAPQAMYPVRSYRH